MRSVERTGKRKMIMLVRRKLSIRTGKRRSGQGMVEYGLILGMVATWVIIFMLALRPIFSERFAADNIENYAGEGQAQIAAELGVELPGVGGGGDDGGDDGGMDDF